jgi:hypothetical protein
MERKFFLITMAMTLCLALGFVVGRKSVPVHYEIMPCEQQVGEVVPFPSFILLPKSEKQSFWDKLVGEL